MRDRVRDHCLPQRNASVVRRNLGVKEHLKTGPAQLGHSALEQENILKRPAAQANTGQVSRCLRRRHTSTMIAAMVLWNLAAIAPAACFTCRKSRTMFWIAGRISIC